MRWNYYKLRQLSSLQIATAFLLQSATQFITSRDRYYNAMDLLQIATVITKCDGYYKLRQYNISIHGTLALVPRASPE